MNISSEISARYGFNDVNVMPLPLGGQDVYEVRFRQGAIVRRGTFRLYYEGAEYANVEMEMRWLSALCSDAGIDVPGPVAALDGTIVQRVVKAADQPPRLAVVQDWVTGDHVAEAITPEQIRNVGKALAHLHTHSRLTRGFEAAESERRAFIAYADDWDGANTVSDDAAAVLEDAGRKLRVLFDSFHKDSADYGFLHGDPHPWNILVDGDRIGLIDFGDCGWGPYAYDIATALVYYKYPWVWDEEPDIDYERLEASLLEGYAAERPLPGNLDELLPICFAARLFVLVQWIVDDLEDVDATRWSRESVSRAVEHLRRFLRRGGR